MKAFKDGKVVDEFIGALPPAQVERFLDRHRALRGRRAGRRGRRADLRRALELEPGRADAAVPLARLLAAAGDREGALELLANVAGSFAADGLAARLRLEDDPELAPAFAALDAGETEAGLDALIDAIAAGDGERKDELRKRRRRRARRARRRAPGRARGAPQARLRAVLGTVRPSRRCLAGGSSRAALAHRGGRIFLDDD